MHPTEAIARMRATLSTPRELTPRERIAVRQARALLAELDRTAETFNTVFRDLAGYVPAAHADTAKARRYLDELERRDQAARRPARRAA